MNNIILTPDEVVFIKKLCQPAPFAATPAEVAMLDAFKSKGIVKVHWDGSIEVSDFGADCYIATVNAWAEAERKVGRPF